MQEAIRFAAETPPSKDERQGLLALNNKDADKTSVLVSEGLDWLIENSFATLYLPKAAGLLIAFNHESDYDSPNYVWFKKRYDQFVYVDRILVEETKRGQGIAQLLYARLFETSKAEGYARVTCEVNRIPPNPGSDLFHERMGFKEVGNALLEGGKKQVRYLAYDLV